MTIKRNDFGFLKPKWLLSALNRVCYSPLPPHRPPYSVRLFLFKGGQSSPLVLTQRANRAVENTYAFGTSNRQNSDLGDQLRIHRTSLHFLSLFGNNCVYELLQLLDYSSKKIKRSEVDYGQ